MLFRNSRFALLFVLSLLLVAHVAADDLVLNELYATAWSPDGRFIAGSGARLYGDNHIEDFLYIWDAQTGIFLKDLHDRPQPPVGRILSLSWSADSSQLVSSGLAEPVIWNINRPDIPQWSIVQILTEPQKPPQFYTATDWKQSIIALMNQEELQIWEWNGSEYALVRRTAGDFFGVAVDNTGTRVAAPSQIGTQVFDINLSPVDIPGTNIPPYLETLPSFDDPLNPPDMLRLTTEAAAWSPDGKKLAVSYIQEKVIRIRDIEQGEIIQTIDAGYAAETLLWNPDGIRLASATSDRTDVWDTLTGVQLANYPSPGKQVNSSTLGWSPDGKQLVYPSFQTGTELPPVVTPPTRPSV